jgi:hypothetical protein
MPPHICKAKHIYYRIVQATGGSTGELEDGADLDDERDGEFEDGEEEDDEEGGMVEVNNNSFTSSADNKQLTMDDDDGTQIDARQQRRWLLGDGLLMGISQVLWQYRQGNGGLVRPLLPGR